MTETHHMHEPPAKGWKGLKQNWRSDFLAAVSVSLVAMPLCLGIAVASGAPPISGLISSIIGGVVVTLFRGSHIAVNGPSAGFIAIILSAIHGLQDGSGLAFQYVLAAICVAGAIQVIMGLFNLGYIAEVIPSSVIEGLMVAIGIIIFTTQLYVALGIPASDSSTLNQLLNVFGKLGDANLVIVLISVVGLAIMIITPKIKSRLLQFFPSSLWVLILSIPMVYAFDFFNTHEVEILGQAYHVGPEFLIDLPDNLSNMILLPNFSKIHTLEFWIAVMSLTLITSIESLAMTKAVDKLDPYKRKSDLNKDLIGIGLGSMVSGAIGGLPVITVVVRSTVNITNNAKTQWSNFYHGVLILIFLFLLAPVIESVPLAALAAILVYIGFRLASPKVFKKTYEAGIEQLLFLVATIIITLATDLLWGIIGGTIFALLLHILLARLPLGKFLRLSIKPQSQVIRKPDGSSELKIAGIGNFLSIPMMNRLIDQIPEGSHTTIDLARTRLVDMTFLEKIQEFSTRQEDQGGQVNIIGLDNHVSSSNHKKALQIYLHPISQKLSPRQHRLKKLAEENDWSFDSHVDWNTSYLRHFQFFEIRPIERKSNCIRGAFNEKRVQWEIADVTFNEGAAFTAEVYNSTVMTLRLPITLPKFVMEKEGLFDKLLDRFMAFSGYKDIDFDLYTDFSKKILLMGEDETAIREFFKPELIRFFEKEHVQHIECNGEALLIFNKLKPARTDETQEIIRFADRLTDHIIDKNEIEDKGDHNTP